MIPLLIKFPCSCQCRTEVYGQLDAWKGYDLAALRPGHAAIILQASDWILCSSLCSALFVHMF